MPLLLSCLTAKASGLQGGACDCSLGCDFSEKLFPSAAPAVSLETAEPFPEDATSAPRQAVSGLFILSAFLREARLFCRSVGLWSRTGEVAAAPSPALSVTLGKKVSALETLGPERRPMSRVPSRGLSEETWRPSSL